MSIDAQLYLLTGGLAAGMLFVAYQAFRLKMTYRSKSSLVGAITFILLAGRQIYGLLRLQHSIAEARARGYMIEHLSLEQWIVGIAWPYLIVVGLIWWTTWQRIDLKNLGV